MLTQQLTENPITGEIRLRNTLDLSDLIEVNMYAQQTDGFTKKRLGRRLMSAPYQVLAHDPDGQIYLAAPLDSVERRLAMIRFLIKFPQYKTCYGKI